MRRPSVLIFSVLLGLFAAELKWSWLQSKLLAIASARMVYQVADGPAFALATAPEGPYDQRLGYTGLPEIVTRMSDGYRVRRQARSSESMLAFSAAGGFPVYTEKSQAGLLILGRSDEPLFSARYPQDIYHTFEDIPPLVVQSLLYIENRKILDDDSPYTNPAVEWNRLARAAGDLAINKLYPAHPISGGSTLATQLEKVRHSPDGATAGTVEKFRQMIAASLRAYRNGEDTTATRREIIRDYINSFPLGAVPGYGEVAGLPEGLAVWFGADPRDVNRLLSLSPDQTTDPAVLHNQAVAYRQVLSLLLALNRPSYYLRSGKDGLDARTEGYLRVLEREGIISQELSQAALSTNPAVRDHVESPDLASIEDKGTLALRNDLLGTFGVPNAYALDRMDVTVSSTIDGDTQRSISQELRALKNVEYAGKAGFNEYRLLGPTNEGSVIFSFTLYERGPQGNLLRVESDNYNQPLSINRGTRLELGSTAKLRTLVTYLEIVTKLHEQYGAATAKELDAAQLQAKDRITRWVLAYLRSTSNRALNDLLEAALDRPYSADVTEKFFTGGGLHTFANFEPKDNGAVLTVRQAFRRSVNLVFIRLMRDVEDYFVWRLPSGSPRMLSNPNDPQRAAYLSRFADIEGKVFLTQFWDKHRGDPADEMLHAMAVNANGNLRRLTVIFRSMRPDASKQDLAAFLLKEGHVVAGEDWVDELYRDYAPQKFNWNDLGYLANLHPLELWLLRYRKDHPEATFTQAVEASKDARQEVYRWLFRKENFRGQNTRIETVLERDAFAEILKSWKRQGYPFVDIVPSYASALGSSGDNPAALAALAGIILNDGVRKPTVRVNEVRFAEGTPYETLLERTPASDERVYPTELAQVVRKAMFDVVENGTARRAFGSVVTEDKSVMAVGGKTGTGDNRIEIRGPHGALLESRAVSRTATFVFVIGDRFFGTVTAYVPGSIADTYRFTSALPVQLFKHLAPRLDPLLSTSKPEPAPTRAGL